MKVKVIDLLNKVANENFLPKVVNSKTGSISYYLYEKCGSECDDRNLQDILNADLEIIEEEKKIPEKLNIELNSGDENKVNYYRATNLECDLAFKINEIIDYLKSKGEQ